MRKVFQPASAFAGQLARNTGHTEALWSRVPLYDRPWLCRQCCQTRCSSWSTHKASLKQGGGKIIHQELCLKLRARYYSTSNDGVSGSKENLPSKQEGRRSHVSKNFSHVMDNLQANVFIAGQRLNDLTGYSGIEALKRDIESQEQNVQTMRNTLQEARDAYTAAISTRASSQREVNELLQRKNTWSPQDLERFTSLYRSDHANEQAEASARNHLTKVETESEEASAKLSTSILTRYHEEQIWSDKIRRMSTWGTWGLMGVNVFLFLIFQIAVEPWRRKRLVKGFEEKVAEALEKEAEIPATNPVEIGESGHSLSKPTATEGQQAFNERVAAIETSPPDETPIPTEEPAAAEIKASDVPLQIAPSASAIGTLRQYCKDMFSERQIEVRRVDLTTAMLEGFGAGISLIGLLVLFLRPR